MKYILAAILLFNIAQAQIGRISIEYQKASTAYSWRWGSYDSVLKVPYGATPVLREAGKDTSRPGALFFSTSDKKLYVYDGHDFIRSSGDAIEGSTHIETTGTYTIPDSVNNLILQFAGGSTITLPDPGSYDKREITIRNVSGNGATFNYSLVYGPGNTSNTLATDKWVKIKSDGTDWNVVQESGSGDQINITGGGGIIIDNF